MRIIVWNTPADFSKQTTEVARVLAERLGDTLHECGEPVDAVEPNSHRSLGASPPPQSPPESPAADASDPGPSTLATDAPASVRVLEQCGNIAADPVRLIVAPLIDKTSEHASARAPDAEDIALQVPVPTLAVGEAAPLAAWLRGQRTPRFLVAHDLSRTADEALILVKQLAELGPCEIVVGHLHRPVDSQRQLGLRTDPLQDSEIGLQRIVEQNLAGRVQRALGEIPAEIRVCASALRHDLALLELVRNERFDLVIAGTNQRHGIERLHRPGSVSRTLLHAAAANLLLVPRVRALAPAARGGISRVLVATDLTDTGNVAVAHAYSLLPHGGTVRLLHVIHPRALPHGEYDQGLSRRATRADHTQVLLESKARLRALAPDPGDAPGVASEFEIVEHAEPAAAIAGAAERFRADVVCLAAHRPDSVFSRLFRRGVDAVMAATQRSVLIVHPPPA